VVGFNTHTGELRYASKTPEMFDAQITCSGFYSGSSVTVKASCMITD
jgi:hypothetical protein